MKKAISFILLVAMLTIILSGCGGSRTPLSTDEFTQIMETVGFDVQDVTADTDTNGLGNAVLIAVGENYQIEFYELVDSETGEQLFGYEKAIFDEAESVKVLSTEMNVNNYNYYAFTGGDTFYLIARIDNTLIYCVASNEYKSEIVDHIKALGYK